MEYFHDGPRPAAGTVRRVRVREYMPDLDTHSDLDAEMRRLLDYLDRKLRMPEPGEDPDDAGRPGAVPYTVHYRSNTPGSELRRVVIVSGPDDPDRGIVNDAKPLARAVLGRSVGEVVTVRQPDSSLDIVLERIEKAGPDDENGAAAPIRGTTRTDQNGLRPYRA